MAIINQLNTQKILSLKEPGRYHDGLGLYLVVTKSGSKNWLFRYRLDGKSREMGVGALHRVSLSNARDKRDAAHKLLAMNVDPIEARNEQIEKMKQQSIPEKEFTFRECAKELLILKQPEWKNSKHAAQWTATFENYVYPIIGDKPVSAITVEDILMILQPIWLTKNETASRVRGRIEKVIGWAKAKKYHNGENPAIWLGNLEFLLQKPRLIKKVKRHPSLDHTLVPRFFRKLILQKTSTAHALAVIILTGLRSSEVRLGTCIEVERDVWSIPPERLKAPILDAQGRELPHLVPLTAIETTLMSQFGCSDSGLFFPGASPGKPISETAVRKLIKNHRGDLPHFSMHGFRSSFKNWCVEHSSLPDKDMLSEAQLCHKLGNDVKIAYLRSNLLDLRRELMQEWRRHCLSLTPVSSLVDLGVPADQLQGYGIQSPEVSTSAAS